MQLLLNLCKIISKIIRLVNKIKFVLLRKIELILKIVNFKESKLGNAINLDKLNFFFLFENN